MVEEIFNSISTYDPAYLYFLLLVVPFTENVFPPFPSDTIIVLIGSMLATGTIHFVPALLICSAGSEAGFLLFYYLGIKADQKIIDKIIHSKKVKFITPEAMQKAEDWFRKYGYGVILFNRFLSGIRSIISFFAGVSNLEQKKTIIYSSVSSVLWHVILLSMGWMVGRNIEEIDYILTTYRNIILILIGLGIIIFLIRYFLKKRKTKQASNEIIQERTPADGSEEEEK
jgi:membrane protein DedA with SNARE-associated domain